MEPSAVLSFWFGSRSVGEPLHERDEWFRKSESFDEEIRTHFGPQIELALAGRLESWSATRPGTLALILLLDQFTRNVFRETPRAFAGDVAALTHARALVYSGRDREFHRSSAGSFTCRSSMRRTWSTSTSRCACSGASPTQDWPIRCPGRVKHFEVIQRFGRFPHRNALLGRTSTLEESEFVAQPGSRF